MTFTPIVAQAPAGIVAQAPAGIVAQAPAGIVAQAPAAFFAQAPAGGGIIQMVPFLAVFAIFYFLVIRPQQVQQRDHKALIGGLKKGDRVVSISGMHGTVHEVKEDTAVLEVADKVRVTIDKDSVKRLADGASSKKEK